MLMWGYESFTRRGANKMAYKIGVVLISLFIGSLALPSPTPVEDDLSDFFVQSGSSARIVGGEQAEVGSVPYMVAMSTGTILKYFLCGGSVIGQRHVLTAAHCIAAVYSRGSLDNSLRVTVGTNRWRYGGQSYRLARNVTHPNYVHALIKNDIGVLVTTTNIAYSNLVQPVPLSWDEVGGGVVSKVAGWGNTRAGGAISGNLLELTVTTIDGQQCVEEVDAGRITIDARAPHIEPHIEICTFHSPNHGTCNGDSGSALVRVDLQEQIGVVSWGFPCARGAPDMFVRVSAYKDWLIAALE